jgi:hypothetical protein
MLAYTTGRVFSLAEQPLANPERETLFADPGRALKQEARGKRPARNLLAQAIAKRVVTNQWKKRHAKRKDMGYLGVMRTPLPLFESRHV